MTGNEAWGRTLREMGIASGEALYGDARVAVWRQMAERENGVLETPGGRLHVKRYLTSSGVREAGDELAGARLLAARGVAGIEFAAWGMLSDGRAVTATPDLGGYISGQAFLKKGGDFEQILKPTARLAAGLHDAGLHHRDLYLCHFFLKPEKGEARLIDVARVRAIPQVFGRRWVVKDLAQFVYSMSEFGMGMGSEPVQAWMRVYFEARSPSPVGRGRWIRNVLGKVEWIARHDLRLREKEPGRAVSIPG